MSVLKHIVAELQCISDNKSSLGSMLLLEYNSNPTNIQITNINTWQDRSSHKIIHNQREIILYDLSKNIKAEDYCVNKT
jgi:hypothetical protein